MDFRPRARAKENPCHIGGAVDGYAGDALHFVALPHPRTIRRRAWNDVPRRDALRGIHPGHAIIGKYEVGALLEIQGCENDGRERNESE